MRQKNQKKSLWRNIIRTGLYASSLFFITSLFYTIYLKWMPPVTTLLMVKRSFEAKGDQGTARPGIRCKWRSYDDISDQAKLAVIAEEDQNFSTHHGFDIDAIQQAIKHDLKGKKIRGGSTISQQVAKNVFLWNGRSWIRKGLEVYFTFLIETIWGKKRILQMYLNVAEMGNGIFGVEAASERYFRKDAKSLNKAEGAMLATILPNPIMYNALHPSAYMLRKQGRVEWAMQTIGGVRYLDDL